MGPRACSQPPEPAVTPGVSDRLPAGSEEGLPRSTAPPGCGTAPGHSR